MVAERVSNVSYGYSQVEQRQTDPDRIFRESVWEQGEGMFRKERVGPSLLEGRCMCVNCN